MTMHRRPLGRGRTLAAIAGAAHRRRLRPAVVAGRRRRPGITAESRQRLRRAAGILVFLVGIATLALVALPYAAGDRPLGLDRWLSFAILAVAGWIGFGWRVIELALIGAFQFSTPAEVVTNGPGLWIAALGLVVLSRATWTMTREPTYR